MGAWDESVLRFVLGGALVSAFALLGEVIKPKTFAGIFCAAPSVALAALILAFVARGPRFVSAESGSMVLGAVAFIGYGTAAAMIVRRPGIPVWLGAVLNWAVWLAIAFGLWRVIPLTS
jgi:hypothetical protein